MKIYTLILSLMTGVITTGLGIVGMFMMAGTGQVVFYLPVTVIGLLVIYGNGRELLARAKIENKPKRDKK